MIGVAVVVSGVLLVAAAAGAIVRLGRGPSLLDRVLAADVLLVVVVSALAVDAVSRRSTDSLPLMAVITVVGFIGSVAVARFAASRRPQEEAAGAGRHQSPEPPTGAARPGEKGT